MSQQTRLDFCYVIVGASFPWAGLMSRDGQPFDALVLIFNAILAWYYLKERQL